MSGGTIGSFGVSEISDIGISALSSSGTGVAGRFQLVLAPGQGTCITAGVTSSLRRIAPDTGALTITGYAPTISVSASWAVRPSTAALQTTGAVPAIHR